MALSSKASSKVAPLTVLTLLTLTISGCNTSSAIRPESSPSYEAVEAALAQTGIKFSNIRLTAGGSYCYRQNGLTIIAKLCTVLALYLNLQLVRCLRLHLCKERMQ